MRIRSHSALGWLLCLLLAGGCGEDDTAESGEDPPRHFAEFVHVDPEVPPEDGWPMAGAGPQRHSWTPEEVRGRVIPAWYKPMDAYIPPKVQLVLSGGRVFVTTAAGLYALDAETGAETWRYPTALPLGHSPTISAGVAYVGGLDGYIHAVAAETGDGLWTYAAAGGFSTSLLVAQDLVFGAARDGALYAVRATGAAAGTLVWQYKTGGPLMFSPAYAEGMVYLASDDGHAYGLAADTGEERWQSAKLPGSGFHSFWPVVYGNHLVIAATHNYRHVGDPFGGQLNNDLDRPALFPNGDTDPKGTLVGPLGTEPGEWVERTPTVDMDRANGGSTNPVTQYYEEKPWRRTYHVLDRFTGEEYTTDYDQDGLPEYAPMPWFGTHGGANRHPPVVGYDGVLYQTNAYMSDEWICGGQVSGWKIGTPFISIISSDWGAVDEPHGYAAGGHLIYWSLDCSSEAGAYDISIPNEIFTEQYLAGDRPPVDGTNDPEREWKYFAYNLEDLAPGYNEKFYSAEEVHTVFGGVNGVYGCGGDVNPPIPYRGKIYMHHMNAVMAFAPEETVSAPQALQNGDTSSATPLASPLTRAEVQALLEAEIDKMVAAGHLRPGYVSSGIVDVWLQGTCGDDLLDYWHHPGDTIVVLLAALPHLSAQLRQQTEAYLQSEFASYPPHLYNHIGWQDGAAREVFDLPPEVEESRLELQARSRTWGDEPWRTAPHAFYAAFKYAEHFGGAATILAEAESNEDLMESFNNPLADQDLTRMPHLLNATIAGYLGYVNLQQLAGGSVTPSVQARLDSLLSLRVSAYSTDVPLFAWDNPYCRSLNAARNFIHLTPELAAHLYDQALPQVQETLALYTALAPYWYVAEFEGEADEGLIRPLYDRHALFQAHARIAGAPFDELVRYLDAPAVATGDLFYIENLVAALQAP